MGKYYAVKKGRKTGIFNSWDECKESVNGYANAIYKSFSDLKEAKNYLYGTSHKNTVEPEKKEIEAYIDGSYDDHIKRYSYAAIIFHKGIKKEFAQSESDINLVALRNVAGELKAAMYVMQYALNNSAKSIEIFYDYNGIEMWATGAWKANTEFTRRYTDYCKQVMTQISIKFTKIKSHTGNQYNEEVDRLAKNALYEPEKAIKEEKNNSHPILESNVSDDVINRLKKTKTSLDIGTFIINNHIINNEIIYNKFKEKWKKDKRKLSEILGLKCFFDLNNVQFVIIVYTKNDRCEVVIQEDDLNG